LSLPSTEVVRWPDALVPVTRKSKIAVILHDGSVAFGSRQTAVPAHVSLGVSTHDDESIIVSLAQVASVDDGVRAMGVANAEAQLSAHVAPPSEEPASPSEQAPIPASSATINGQPLSVPPSPDAASWDAASCAPLSAAPPAVEDELHAIVPETPQNRTAISKIRMAEA
jgi:hypothetical protein